MSRGPDRPTPEAGRPEPARTWPSGAIVAAAAAVGLGLLIDASGRSSATYDEVAYLQIGADWWRTGREERITRMGSPLTFWKVQQAPVLALLDRLGRGHLLDDPTAHQAELLPLVRLGCLWIWLAALLATAAWSRRLYGPRAMALAAALFALSPNLLAHGALATMELPLLACTTGVFFLFWEFLRTGRPAFFALAAALTGLAFSCKFTAVLVPPILGLAWWADRRLGGERGLVRLSLRVGCGMLAFLAVLVVADLVVTGFARLPLSPRTGSHPSLEGRLGPVLGGLVRRAIETPIPQDWVGFVTQMRHQRHGGPSYLLGATRMRGWWYYYVVALAVKVPLAFWLLATARAACRRRIASAGHDGLLAVILAAFLAITALGSSRNYGLRYLLPLAPVAIVWVSALAEGGAWARRIGWVGAAGMALAVASIHPHELSYFNALAGGPRGGRHVLADSNLDWGQGARALARLQAARPELRDLTLFYFGDTDPAHYGVVGRRHVIDAGDRHPDLPPALAADTAYLAVSTSLQWGPWGPRDYFRSLDRLRPVATLDDFTIAIYRTADLRATRSPAFPSQ
ncbi:MAG TPA: glycosyltransferase family 39 protein [Isosphaeraceae bacterium]|jgi:4-amino-4-deoxy-L-arabinose transferase-like glycosyltransferase